MYISEVCVKNVKLTTLTHKSRAWPSVLPKQLTMLAADAKNSKKIFLSFEKRPVHVVFIAYVTYIVYCEVSYRTRQGLDDSSTGTRDSFAGQFELTLKQRFSHSTSTLHLGNITFCDSPVCQLLLYHHVLPLQNTYILYYYIANQIVLLM